MAQPKAQQEPTMEEILASIRRIIDSGEETERDYSERSDHNPPEYSDPAMSGEGGSASVHNLMQPDVSDSESEHSEDVSQADRVVISRTHGTKDSSHTEEGGADAIASEELREATNAIQQEVYPGSIGEVADQVLAASAMSDDQENVSSNGTTPESASKDDEAGLVSADAEARITSALQELSVALNQEGVRSIEEIVAEELRPLLSAWLDQNMPSIVERMVAKELERMRKPAHD